MLRNTVNWLNSPRTFALALALCLATATACNNAGRVPRDILPPREMQAILVDMQLADAYNQQQPFASDTLSMAVRIAMREHQLKEYYAQILELHHTTRGVFMNSYRYYTAHPDLLKAMFDGMTVKLRQMRNHTDSLLNANRKKADSARIKEDSLQAKKDTIRLKNNAARLKKDTVKIARHSLARKHKAPKHARKKSVKSTVPGNTPGKPE